MEDFSIDKISEILSSPEMMKNVQSVLGQLTSNSESNSEILPESINGLSQEVATNPSEINSFINSIASFLSKNKAERIALLTALKPFLSIEKQNIIDSILQILKLSGIFTTANLLK